MAKLGQLLARRGGNCPNESLMTEVVLKREVGRSVKTVERPRTDGGSLQKCYNKEHLFQVKPQISSLRPRCCIFNCN